MTKEALDLIADTVLAHDPTTTPNVLHAIAGAPDKPLVIGDVELSCYVLENEERVFSLRTVTKSVGLPVGGGTRQGVPRIVDFLDKLAAEGIKNDDLTARIRSPIEFRPPTGRTAHGYPATMLVDFCSLVVEARSRGLLSLQSQQRVAEHCAAILTGVAKVGVIALVDEATGYQYIREERALARILEAFIAKELQQWTRTFPMDFYRQLCRLRDWPNIYSVKRPAAVATYTNGLVYSRLAPGVLDELREKNPKVRGRRKHKHHQWLTPDTGHPKLKEHLHAVIALMKSSTDWDDFMMRLDLSLPVQTDQTTLNFEV